MTIRELLTAGLLFAGAFFFLAGTLGLLRFPDAHARLHALTKADNLGLGLVVAGLAIQASGAAEVAKLVVLWLLVLLSSATTAYLIGGAAAARRQTARNDG